MNFSDKDFEALAPFESYFRTAVDADWCPNPGRAALVTMHAALDAHDGRTTRQDYNCGQCLLRLVKRVGYLYFADKTAREAAPAPKKATPKAKKK